MASSSQPSREKRKSTTHHSKPAASSNAGSKEPSSSSPTRNQNHRPASHNQGTTSSQKQQPPTQQPLQGTHIDDHQFYSIQRHWQQRQGATDVQHPMYTSPIGQWQSQPASDEPWNDISGVFYTSQPLRSDDPVQSASWPDDGWSMDVWPDQHGR